MQEDLFGHPRGLLFCALTEMWEFFSYFGMRALLIFFLTQRLLVDDAGSYAIYGAFIGLTWALPILGGILADRYIGYKRAITLGAVLMITGYVVLAVYGGTVEGAIDAPGGRAHRADESLDLFYISLGFIVCGVGLMKGNLTALVGLLYGPEDVRRDSGYSLYYFGANVGGAVAPLLCGWLGQAYGWRYGFGAAGFGMLGGLGMFLKGLPYLNLPKTNRRPMSAMPALAREGTALVAAVAVSVAVGTLIMHHELMGIMLGVFVTTMVSIVVFWTLYRCSISERSQIYTIMMLSGFSVIFFSFYEQMGSSLNLFIDRFVDLSVAGLQIRSAQVVSLAAIFALILAPLFSTLWIWLSRRGQNPTATAKVSAGMILLGIAFLMPVIGVQMQNGSGGVSLIWLVFMFFFMECAEICTVPIAFSVISRLSPRGFVGAMMGVYFLCLSLGSYLSGKLAGLTSRPGRIASVGPVTELHTYVSVFIGFAISLMAIGGVVLASSSLGHSISSEPARRRAT